MNRRIIVKESTGLRRIVGTEDQLGGTPREMAYGHFQQARLEKVEKRYALYTMVVPVPVEDDGA